MELKAPIVCVLPFGNYGGNLCYMLLIFETITCNSHGICWNSVVVYTVGQNNFGLVSRETRF